MAKKKAMAREYVWLQCSETGDLNYRTSINTKGGIDEASTRFLLGGGRVMVDLAVERARPLPSAPSRKTSRRNGSRRCGRTRMPLGANAEWRSLRSPRSNRTELQRAPTQNAAGRP